MFDVGPSEFASDDRGGLHGTPDHRCQPSEGDLTMDLPTSRAFLVRFSRDANLSRERFCGRVEHVQTGRRATFSSPGELQAFMAGVVDEEEPQPAPPTPERGGDA